MSNPSPSRSFSGWVTLVLGIGTLVALIASFPFWGERSFMIMLAFVILFPATVISALIHWWPRRQAGGVVGAGSARRRLNLSALGLIISAALCLVLGVTWFGTALGTMLMVAGTLLLPLAVIALLLAFSLRSRGRLADTSLAPGEQIILQGEVHWGVFIPTIGVATAVLLLVLAPLGTTGHVAATILYLIVLPGTAAQALSTFLNTELEITQNQLAAATGLIIRTTRVVDRQEIQAAGVNRGWLGRLLGYGRLSIICRDGTSFKVPGIIDPEGVRMILMRTATTREL